MAGNVLDIGQVTGLDYKNPTTDPHNELQRMKEHPAIRKMLEGAKMIRYGAKAIPEGGLFAMPRLYSDGLLLNRRYRRISQRHASQGRALGDEVRNDGGRNDLGRVAGRDVSTPRSSRRSNGASATRGRTPRCASARNFHQGFQNGLLAGHGQRRRSRPLRAARGFGFIDKLPGEPGTSAW